MTSRSTLDDAQGAVAAQEGRGAREEGEGDQGLHGRTSRCGQAYHDIYNRDPEATKNDEVLYNAGVCFEEGKSIGAAIQAFDLLQKYYPN